MNRKLSPLVELQKFDLRIMEINDQRRKIPEKLHSAEAPLRDASQILKDTTAALDLLVKERRSHEKDLEAHEAQTEKMKSRLSELKTNKEYQAHLFEIELSNKKRGDFEEKILICMEKIDQLQRTVKETQEKVKAAEKMFAEEKQTLDGQERTLAAELGQLEAQHREAAAHVDPGLLKRYAELKASRKDHALAAVRDGMCSGCRLQIPPQLIAEVKRSEDLHACPYCRRMLYWEGEIPTDQVASHGEGKKSDLEIGESV